MVRAESVRQRIDVLLDALSDLRRYRASVSRDVLAADRDSLRTIMSALDVSEDPSKAALGQAAEVLGRLKSNGMFTQYSPSSRVIELEGLLAGIDAKRNLWHSLRLAAATRPALDVAALDKLIDRASSQRDRLHAEHQARTAFAAEVAAA